MSPTHRTPDEERDVRIEKPSKTAAGPKSVRSVMRHAREEMGLIRGLRVLSNVNQTDGFDCPGCAWPDPEHPSAFEYCENGAKAVAEEATLKRVDPEFFARHSVEALGRRSDFWLGKQGRITHPMVLRAGASHYEPISWEGAFACVAEALTALDSPDEAVFYTSGRTSNEAAYLYQLFVRMFGTNNLPDCSNMCHESSGVGLSEVIGVGKGTVTLQDFEEAEVIVVIGQNPGTNHPRMLSTLAAAKRRGAHLVHINPLPETGLQRFKHPQEVKGWLSKGTKMADHFLQVCINGDVALLSGLAKRLLEVDETTDGHVLDPAFIDSRTEGFDEFADHMRSADWDTISRESGIAREQIDEVAGLLARSSKIVFCWAMGLTQHENAVANIQMIVNLLLMKGAIGRPGAGVCPVRGHSNVQGDRTVGITHRPKPAFLDALAGRYAFEPPRSTGLDTVDAIRAMHEGRIRVFVALGGNFLSATPDTDFTASSLRRCDLTVHVSTKLNRAHVVTGQTALILPCLGRTEKDDQALGEQFVSVENSMGIVHASCGHLEPASENLLSEPAIVAGIADAVLGSRFEVPWLDWVADYDRIRDEIEHVIPGFENYAVRVRDPNGFYLPNGARDGRFGTASGLARFTLHDIPEHHLADDEFMMMTMRSHDQYNTTIYGLDDRYRGIRGGRRVVFVNEDDARERGLSAGDKVDLLGEYNGQIRRADNFTVVPFAIPRQCVATYFPEANVLVPHDKVAAKSNTPASKSVVVRLERARSRNRP